MVCFCGFACLWVCGVLSLFGFVCLCVLVSVGLFVYVFIRICVICFVFAPPSKSVSNYVFLPTLCFRFELFFAEGCFVHLRDRKTFVSNSHIAHST